MSELEEGTVVLATGGFYDVDTGAEVVRCTMRGRLKREKQKTDLCVIGDRVRFDPADQVMEEVLPRRTVFSRRHPGRGGQYKEDVLVANLDQLCAVFAYGEPPLRPRLLDRFLAIAEHNDLEAVVVANKLDQESAETRRMLDGYEALGYPVLHVSAATGVGLEDFRARLNGRISALSGPSGVGKSSLLNALDAGLALRVAAVSGSHHKGRHTTRVATLHPVAGGYVADTPGIRELGAWDLPGGELDRCFVEMRPYLGSCSFGDCTHLHEPGCAVKQAVGSGEISPERYESYGRLMEG